MLKYLIMLTMTGLLIYTIAVAYFNRDIAVPFAAEDYRVSHLQLQQQLPPENLTAIGEQLFQDKRLSGDASIACASCHLAQFAFADKTPLSKARALTKVNTPSLFNLGYYPHFFWNGRAKTLQDQIREPLFNQDEHHLDPASLKRIAEAAYAEAFADYRQHFPEGGAVEFVSDALASYIGRLESLASPFDKFMATYQASTEPEFVEGFGPDEWHGYQVFLGKARCASCHSGALFTDQKFYVTGLANATLTDRSEIKFRAPASVDPEMGLTGIRTPTLRNLADTAPYFHDGSAPTIREVIYRYMRPQTKTGVNQDITQLYLNATEVDNLEAFLRSLQSPVVLQNRQVVETLGAL